MHLYIQIGNFVIPSYGLMIVIGVISANLIAIPLISKYGLDSNDFIIVEAYTFLGGFLGAKALYLWVSRSGIAWNRIWEIHYFNQIMQGGFVFYGGLIGGIAFAFLAGKIHHINSAYYIQRMIFLIPWIHCFGRIGCFMAGCCYGRPYQGIGAVIFPTGSLAPAGIPLFPVQLLEAIGLLLISAMILCVEIKWKLPYTVELYLISYAILRFILEYFRYDEVRGKWLFFSTGQWISLLLFGLGVISMIFRITICLKRKSEL